MYFQKTLNASSLQWSGVKSALPDNVHLLTLEQWGGPSIEPSLKQPYMIRLEHFYEKGEDKTLSQPATVSLQVNSSTHYILQFLDQILCY